MNNDNDKTKMIMNIISGPVISINQESIETIDLVLDELKTDFQREKERKY